MECFSVSYLLHFLTIKSFITDFDGCSGYVDWQLALLRFLSRLCPGKLTYQFIRYAGTSCLSTAGRSPLQPILANECITLRFFCGKEPSIGGAIYLRIGDSELAPVQLLTPLPFSQFIRNVCLFTKITNLFNGGLVFNTLSVSMYKH